jgi:diguanylate cyclase (GGDEF)-like protein
MIDKAGPDRKGSLGDLRSANDVRAACRAVVEHLASTGGLLPSVYLARGGRLRCVAARGYWQIFDGMLSSVGVIGRTWTSKEETLIADVDSAPEYLSAAPGVRAEICCPLFFGGVCVGALNVEAQRPLPDVDLALIRACAAALSGRMHELGGPPAESPAQRLVRHSLHLNELDAVEDVRREVVSAALDVVPLSSGAVVSRGGGADGTLHVRDGSGPLLEVLCDAPQDALRTISQYVAAGTSCYTVGDPVAGLALGMGALRYAGAESLAAAAIGAAGDFLLLADSRQVVLATDEVELLELLCAHAASSLLTASATARLRVRAASDPLTGLGHHGTFHETLAASRPRANVAVLMIDIDGFKAINDAQGHQAGDQILRETAVALCSALRRSDEVFRVGGDEFAAIINVADGSETTDAAERLRTAVRDAEVGVTVSIGGALAHAREDRRATVARADRALYEVKAAGRDGVALAGAVVPAG